MSEKFIPEHIDPFRYAEQGLTLSGAVKLENLHRIANNLNSLEGKVHVDLSFHMDDHKIANIKGKLEATLTLQCQRCMGPFIYEIMADFALGVVNTLKEANALPEHYEPVIAEEGGQLSLYQVVEDELILGLPIIPKHEPEVCAVKLETTETGVGQDKTKNPFHVLETLKKQKSR